MNPAGRAEDWHWSVALLAPCYALSEVWRAPTAVMTRDAGPTGSPSASTAAHLACRNVLAGLGPLAAATLSPRVGLQNALLLTPACYAAASWFFYQAGVELEERDPPFCLLPEPPPGAEGRAAAAPSSSR